LEIQAPLNRATAGYVKYDMTAAVSHRFVVQRVGERTVTALSVASVSVAAGTDPEAAYAAGGRQPSRSAMIVGLGVL
jgi:hypothetical protein